MTIDPILIQRPSQERSERGNPSPPGDGVGGRALLGTTGWFMWAYPKRGLRKM